MCIHRILFSITLAVILVMSVVHVVLAKNSINLSAISIPDGYKIEAFVTNLSVPTNAVFDGNDLLVAESGFEKTAKPRVLRIHADGKVETVVEEGLQSPVTGLLVIDGVVYVSHRTKVSRVEAGKLVDVVTDLPSKGDHQNNTIVLGEDGYIYMGQGTTTNSGLVGEDNYIFGWLDKQPTVHEVPCTDITLTGKNFISENPLKKGSQKVTTGAYKPFGIQSKEGEVIKGNVKCGGSVVRFRPDGSDFQVVAWGLRNPFGLAFDQNDQLWATYHGADVRGSRNIYNDGDYLVKIDQGAWYGWPEYFNGLPVTDDRFHAPGQPKPEFLWKEHPQLTMPFATFPTHVGANGLTAGPESFGFADDIFVALYGSYTGVTTGVNPTITGFSVVAVNTATGEIRDFVKNKLPGPSYLNKSGGLNRPSAVLFGPDEQMYIVDWGAATFTTKGLEYVPGTGTIWRVYKADVKPIRVNGPIMIESVPIPPGERNASIRNTPALYRMLAPVVLIYGVFFLIFLAVLWWLYRSAKKSFVKTKKKERR